MPKNMNYEELKQRVKELEREVSKRVEAAERIMHLNAVLYAICEVNELILKERNRKRLLNCLCDKLVGTRGYYNSWIALINESSELLDCVEAGLGDKFMPMLRQLESGKWTDRARKALRQSDILVTQNPVSSCQDCPLSNMYRGRGAMTKRLEYSGKVYGLFSASVPRDFVADKEEQFMFQEIAGNIAFALHSLEEERERKLAEQALRSKEKALRLKTVELEKANIALEVLLKKTEENKKELGEKVLINVKRLVFPYLEKLKKLSDSENQLALIDNLESNLNEIISPFLKRLSSTKFKILTPAELQIANLIKEGKTSKEIAQLLNTSKAAIDFHRQNLRKKLGLKSRKSNLRSHLLTLSQY
ncbi:MAG: LuxR C-terminal-related transcriptional regulator [Desulfobacteraceae bacterium]|jgi:DNA-binding CsgD family transcriptional regulator